MQPEHLIFGGGAVESRLQPFVAVCMIIAILLILLLPRNKVIVAFLLSFFTIPLAQVIVVGSLHFPVLRILMLAGLVRMVLSSASSGAKLPGGFNAVDRVVVLWTISLFIVLSLQWLELPAFVKFVADFIDALGGYLVLRFLIPDSETVKRTIKVLALICVIQGVCMVSEQFTHQNVFASLGMNQPALRDGHIRSEGTLGTLYGGTFAGVLMPMFLWLWNEGKSRMAACAGIVGATAMVFASHASTSWLAYAAGLGGLCFWPLRDRMRLLRFGIVGILVGLHLVMHGPVWSLIEKIDLTGGSSSYHRYMLVDNCIRHFSDWWLLGYKNYGDWGFDMWDLCNQFVAVALTGGLISLILFIMIYSRGFSAIGKARKLADGDKAEEWFLWCLGSTLFANIVASFGINYMVQLETALFALLACISVATLKAVQPVVSGTETVGYSQFTSATSAARNCLPIRELR
jgi:hypothetical protein